MVNKINNQLPIGPKAIPNPHQGKGKANQADKPSGTQPAMDTVSLSQKDVAAATYINPISPEEMIDKGYEMLRQLVTNLLKEQNIDTQIATGSSDIDIENLTQEEAQELIADDGYFGVEQTSDRIVDFAISLAGGDVSRLAAIKEGVQAGFDEALQAFGGELPEISYNTLDAVMQKLDDWATGSESVNV